MSKLQKTLNQLESQLRTLIEGSLEKAFPSGVQADLAHLLVAAMRKEMRVTSDGVQSAPNIYTLLIPPSHVEVFIENQGLLDELARSLEDYAHQTGILIERRPIIKVVPMQPDGDPEQRVLASFSQENLGETSRIEISTSVDTEALPPGAFLIVNGTHVVPLKHTVINIGRGDNNDLVIGDLHVSRQHAQLRAIRGSFTIFDLSSSGGTYVNSKRIIQQVLSPGDLISLAGVPLIYGEEQPHSFEETQDLSTLDRPDHEDIHQ